ncbi:MAG: hypothetical protein ABFE07_04910 [Armatimonadia bacterium]
MANGYKSLHPLTQEVLQQLGVPDGDVTQAWGSAPASAGYHAAEGYYKGRKFSSCVDLEWEAEYRTTAWKSRAVAAGLLPFYRDWLNNRHIHCVHVGLKDTKGRVTILSGPRTQIVDYTRGLNGLVGHAKLTGKLAPTAAERKDILERYAAWAPSYATKVYLNGKRIPCYAWLDGTVGAVTVEVRPLLEAMGFRILDWAGSRLLVRSPMADTLELSNVTLGADLHGEFLRAPVRSIVKAIEGAVYENYPFDVAYVYVEDGPDRVDITVNAKAE